MAGDKPGAAGAKKPAYRLDAIRNFCIIAHVDHGKSTLADRFLEITRTVTREKMRAQYMDQLDVERERGITVKAAAVRMFYESPGGQTYQLNLIDTPGHVDFSYEVSRSLAACEGAVLLVDVSQGVEAQTVSNLRQATDAGLTVIAALNKCDIKGVDIDRSMSQLIELGFDPDHIIQISGKTGMGVDELLEKICREVPAPKGDPDAPLAALIFDSSYDNYRGALAYIRVKQGQIRERDRIRLMGTGLVADVTEVGVFTPEMVKIDVLRPGEVGYLGAGLRALGDIAVGDTVCIDKHPPAKPLPGYRPSKPMVYASLFATNEGEYEQLKAAFEKLVLNDAAVTFEPEVSDVLGFGIKCGFLGLLHMEIVVERLMREFNMDVLVTAPSVVYRAVMNDGSRIEVKSPADLPDRNSYEDIEELRIGGLIFTPVDYVGPLMQLLEERRGVMEEFNHLDPKTVILRYDLPLSEVITDFYDRLKSVSRGYASFDYEVRQFKPADLVRLQVAINAKPVDAMSAIVHRSAGPRFARLMASKIQKHIPRQMFEIAIQVSMDGRIVARETVKALRKNVTAKCYGGDITRKRKLLEKQKEGKKRMRHIGNVEVPKEAFLSIMKVGEE